MRSLYRTIRFILTHPLGRKKKLKFLKRFVSFQLGMLFNAHPIVYPLTNKCKLVVEKGMTGATGNIYVGLHEFEDMGFLLHYLRKVDLFLDVGANVGTYTILASAHVRCRTIAIEPIPQTFIKLKRNVDINNIQERVQLLNMGVSSDRRELNFTYDFDATNHVLNDSNS